MARRSSVSVTFRYSGSVSKNRNLSLALGLQIKGVWNSRHEDVWYSVIYLQADTGCLGSAIMLFLKPVEVRTKYISFTFRQPVFYHLNTHYNKFKNISIKNTIEIILWWSNMGFDLWTLLKVNDTNSNKFWWLLHFMFNTNWWMMFALLTMYLFLNLCLK